MNSLAARTDADLRARALPPFQQVVLWLLRDARDPERLLRGFEGWVPTILRAGCARCGADAIAVMRGRQEGQREGLVAALRSQLIHKHGSLDVASEIRLDAATPEALDRYLRHVLTADSLAAVFAD